jgi:autophagy-related protein 9
VDIIEGRSAIWFLGVGGTLVAILRNLIPEESQIRDPQKTMETIVQHTHYLPKHWKNNVHTYNVYLQFSRLFELKAVLVVMEMLSVLLTPWMLLVSLPRSAGKVRVISGINRLKIGLWNFSG